MGVGNGVSYAEHFDSELVSREKEHDPIRCDSIFCS